MVTTIKLLAQLGLLNVLAGFTLSFFVQNKTFAITAELLNEGIFVNPVVSPAVAPQDTLIRYSLMATHTKEQVDFSLEKIQKVFRKFGVIK